MAERNELDKLQSNNQKLRQQIAEERNKQAALAATHADELRTSQLKRENEALEAELAQLKEANKLLVSSTSTSVKEAMKNQVSGAGGLTPVTPVAATENQEG